MSQVSNVHEVMLKKFNFSWKMELHDRMIMDMNNVQLTHYMDHALTRAIYRLDLDVFGQDLEAQIWKMPADWKEAIKERFFPKWLLRKFPVKHAIFKLDVAVLYPQLEMPQNIHKPYFHYKGERL